MLKLKYITKYLKYLITLRYIKLFAYHSAKSLQQSRQETHKHRYTYYYGFQVIYGAINKFLLLILLGLLLNILPQLLLVTLSFVSLRIWIGGLHFDNYAKCAYFSLTMFIIMAFLAKYIYLNQIASIIIFIYVFIVILLYAPVEHPNRPLKENDTIKFKAISCCILVILFIVNIFINNTLINNSILYGILLSGLIALPIINKCK